MRADVDVSVVIPCYNGRRFIADAIESTLRQSLPPSEVIVVDDGSTDDSAAIASSFGRPVRVVRQANAGVAAARNEGVACAAGDLIAFNDADDVWLPQKLERQVAYLAANPDVVLVGSGWVGFRDGADEVVRRVSDRELRAMTALDFLARYVIGPPTIVVRRAAARAIRFPQGVALGEDVIYVALARTRGLVGAVDEVLLRRRIHHGQATAASRYRFKDELAQRLRWAERNYRAVGAASAAAAQARILDGFADVALSFYFRRDLATFRLLRRELLECCPPGYRAPRSLRRFVPPRALLSLKDRLDRWRGARHGESHAAR